MTDPTNCRRCRNCEEPIIAEIEAKRGLSHVVALLAGFCSRTCAELDAAEQLRAGDAWWQTGAA